MAVNIQAEAIRRKNAGDPRSLPEIVRELSMVMPADPGLATVNPSPAQPIPVGQAVDIKPSVPPMTTPYSPVERAREVAPQVAPAAAMSATDAALQTALASKDPIEIARARMAADEARAREDAMRRRTEARQGAQVDPEYDAYFKRMEERAAQREAAMLRDEKKDAWEALALAGFKMAQSSSPYFAAALAEGMQAGLQGYNAERAARAEQRARLEDARDTIGLQRLKVAREAQDRALGDLSASEDAAAQTLQRQAAALQMELEITREPQKRALLEAQLRQINANIANDNIRTGLAVQAARRAGAGGGGGNAMARAQEGAMGAATKFASDMAMKDLEGRNLTPENPAYGAEYAKSVNRFRNIYFATNPIAASRMGVDPSQIKLDFAPPAPRKKDEESWWRKAGSFLNPFD